MTTDKMKKAVAFCETWLKIKFVGDINNFKCVSTFLDSNLETAKDIALEASCDYAAEHGI